MSDNTQATPTPAAEVASIEDQTLDTGAQATTDASVAPADAAAVAAIAAKDPKNLTPKEQKLVKKYQLKIDGRTEDFELDLNNDEEVKKHLQMARAGQNKMQQAAEMRKATEEFIELLKTNPRRVLTDPNIGVDLKKLAQEIINEEIENAQKTPEQRQIEEYKKQLEEIKEKQDKDEKDRKSAEYNRLVKDHEERVQTSIEGALKASDLPKTAYTVRKMVEMMQIALANNVDLSPNDIVPLIRKQMIADYKELTTAASDDILEDLIGKENISRIRKRTAAKMKAQPVAQTANAVKAGSSTGKAAEAKPKEKVSVKDWLNGKASLK